MVSDISKESLDTVLSVNANGTVSTSVLYKPADTNCYVNDRSNHPKLLLILGKWLGMLELDVIL